MTKKNTKILIISFAVLVVLIIPLVALFISNNLKLDQKDAKAYSLPIPELSRVNLNPTNINSGQTYTLNTNNFKYKSTNPYYLFNLDYTYSSPGRRNISAKVKYANSNSYYPISSLCVNGVLTNESGSGSGSFSGSGLFSTFNGSYGNKVALAMPYFWNNFNANNLCSTSNAYLDGPNAAYGLNPEYAATNFNMESFDLPNDTSAVFSINEVPAGQVNSKDIVYFVTQLPAKSTLINSSKQIFKTETSISNARLGSTDGLRLDNSVDYGKNQLTPAIDDLVYKIKFSNNTNQVQNNTQIRNIFSSCTTYLGTLTGPEGVLESDQKSVKYNIGNVAPNQNVEISLKVKINKTDLACQISPNTTFENSTTVGQNGDNVNTFILKNNISSTTQLLCNKDTYIYLDPAIQSQILDCFTQKDLEDGKVKLQASSNATAGSDKIKLVAFDKFHSEAFEYNYSTLNPNSSGGGNINSFVPAQSAANPTPVTNTPATNSTPTTTPNPSSATASNQPSSNTLSNQQASTSEQKIDPKKLPYALKSAYQNSNSELVLDAKLNVKQTVSKGVTQLNFSLSAVKKIESDRDNLDFKCVLLADNLYKNDKNKVTEIASNNFDKQACNLTFSKDKTKKYNRSAKFYIKIVDSKTGHTYTTTKLTRNI